MSLEKIKSYRDLIAWQKSMKLVTDIFLVTEEFPNSQLYTLTNQLQRAAISIPSNIAEGFSRKTSRNFLHFLSISMGSLYEVQTQIEIAQNIGYMNDEQKDEIMEQTIEIEKILHGLMRSIRNNKGAKP